MKTVLITGCSTGIGYSTALLFARRGFNVIATMRNLDKSHDLLKQAKQEKLNIDIRHLDITDDSSIQMIVASILQDYKKIDVLINNAGAGFLGTLEQTSLTQAKEIMDVNFFGIWRLTQAILPSMRMHKAGHIISITSVGGLIGQPFNDAYCAAKFAVEGMMESLAPVLKRFNIHVSLVEPGPVNSEFVTATLKKSPELNIDLEKDYKHIYESFYQAIEKSYADRGQSADEIAEIILFAANDKQPSFRYQTSESSKQFAHLKLTDPTGNQLIALTASSLGSEG